MNRLSAAALVFLLTIPVTALAWDASIVPSTRKVTVVPTAPVDYPTYASATLEGCRNEWEAFQVVIKSDVAETGINVSVSDLSDDQGNVIPSGAATLYREWFLNIVNPSGLGIEVENHLRRPGLYPDPLIPFVDPYSDEIKAVGAPFNLTVDDPGLAVVFVDIHIPSDAVPGNYGGTVTVSADGRTDVVLPVSLTVWELDMPTERNVGTAFRMSDSQVRRYHGGTDLNNTDPDFPEIVRNYYNAAHDHRTDATGFTGPVQFNFDESGALLPVDWTAYDEYMTPFLEGSYFNDGVGVARFDVGMFGPGRSRSLTDDQYKQASAALAQHLYDKGWWDEAWVYSKDEPWLKGFDEPQESVDADMARVANEAALLIEGSELWKGHILVTGPMFEQAAASVGIWCPVQPMYGKWYWTEDDYAGRGDYDQHLANGGELWFYNCNGNTPPFAGYDIDTQIGYEPRILKWGSWWERATGYLYWRQLYWGDFDPWVEWQDIPGFGGFFARNGDGLLMYPGDGNGHLVDGEDNPVVAGTPPWLHIDGPIVSFRLKQIRDGFEDWELFILAEKAGIGDWTRQEMVKVYRRFGNFMQLDCSTENYYCPDDEPWTLDENMLLEVRHRIAAKLLFTLYPDRYEDPDAPVVGDVVEDPVQVEVEDIITGDLTAGDIAESTADTAAGDPGSTTDVPSVDSGAGVDTGSGSSGGCTASGNSSQGLPALIMLLALATAIFFSRVTIRNKKTN